MSEIVRLGNRIEMIDLHDLNMEGRTGSYIIREQKPTIIETSASPSIPYLLKGLKKLEVDPYDIEYIIVTHIHLDHAGGAGLLLEKCPNAKVVVHPKGYRHLLDPSRLITGARAVYGEDFDRLFDPIVPIPENKLIVKEHGEKLKISDDCELTFYDSPGHAKHHFSIFDPKSNGIFTGDTAGVYYHMLQDMDIELYLPSTSPNQYDPNTMLQSIELFENLNVDRIYFGHFGMSSNPSEIYKQIREWTPVYIQAVNDAFDEIKSDDFDKLCTATINNLTTTIHEFLDKQGVPSDHKVYQVLEVDIKVCAMGLVDYQLKQRQE